METTAQVRSVRWSIAERTPRMLLGIPCTMSGYQLLVVYGCGVRDASVLYCNKVVRQRKGYRIKFDRSTIFFNK